MRKVFVMTVFFGSLGAALGAHAEDHSGFYLGGSIGEATNESGEFKGSDTAFKLSGGYAFNQYFGIEVAYIDAGTQDDTIGLTEFETESTGIIASAVVRLPIGERFAMFSKAGYAFYDSETTARLGNLSARESGSDGDFEIVSAGAVYKF